MTTLPGAAVAKEKGYALHSYGATRRQANYIKNINGYYIYLTVRYTEEGAQEATLSRQFAMIDASVTLGLPSNAFDILERQLKQLQEEPDHEGKQLLFAAAEMLDRVADDCAVPLADAAALSTRITNHLTQRITP